MPRGGHRAVARELASVVIACASVACSGSSRSEASDAAYQRLAQETQWGPGAGHTTVFASASNVGAPWRAEVTPAATEDASSPGEGTLTVRVVGAGGAGATWAARRGSSFVVVGDLLVRSEYDTSASGCALVAIDLRAGRERWRVRVRGLGDVVRAPYENHVALARIDDAHVIVWGDESAGRYAEIVELTTGRTVGQRRYESVAR